MSIPGSRPFGFSATIRETGKEWVTSEADKQGIAAEVVENMQSTLTVLQFPLTSVLPSAPEAEPIAQDFTMAFSEDLPGLEGELASIDQTATGTDQLVAWIAPVMPVATVVPVALQTAEFVSVAQGEQVTLPGVAVSLVGQLVPPNPGERLASGNDPGFAITMVPERDEGAPALDPVDGMAVKPTWDPLEAMPQARMPSMTAPTEVRADDLTPVGRQVTPVNGKVEEGAPTSIVVEYVPKGATDASLVASAQVTVPVDQPAGTRPARGEEVASAPSVKLSEVGRSDSKEVAASIVTIPTAKSGQVVRPTEDEKVVAQDAGGRRPDEPTRREGQVAPLPKADLTATVDPAQSKPPVPGSFWERYFTDRSEALPNASIPEHRALPEVASIVAQTVVAARPLKLPEAVPENAKPLDFDLSVSPDTVIEGDFPVREPSPPVKAAPSLAPEPLPEAAPQVQLMPWVEVAPDQIGRFDSALSLASGLSSVSASSATAGGQMPLTLPVQQVAAQLAGVLVQASDRGTELALAPEELGKVRLRLEPDAANPDRMTIVINVERPETLDLFRRHAGELADAIRAAGYSGADIDFGQHAQGDSADHPHAGAAAGSELPADETAPLPSQSRPMTGAALDLRL